MAGLRHYREPRHRNGSFHHEVRIKARFILVTRHDVNGHRHLRHTFLQIVERGPFALHADKCIGAAERRVFIEPLHERGKPSRILILELDTRRTIGVEAADAFHTEIDKALRNFRGFLAPLIAIPSGAITAPGDNTRQRHFRKVQSKMERGEAAHREANDMRLLDSEMLENVSCVFGRSELAV